MTIQMILMVAFLGILVPTLLPLIVAVLGYLIPDLGVFFSKLLWAVLGDLETVNIVAGILETALSDNRPLEQSLITIYVNLLSGAVLEAAVLGCCIYFVKSLFIQFRNGEIIGSYRIGRSVSF